ncbi:efflux RND transporter periplasmic adaptor subunit [Aeromonas schubertii]|uniref:efflux RND transporter periplasmic adaptor subunit n=1 Tax=Aeromonas schubertii TaxID=652 RepID=UPI001CC40AFE|nr:efflux RND transporter periplasmic adaptor subunit [Aeromonas schubertii]MBZ6074576.1 efflux RND transporter periplasmic adaptor subunit [Aeromonas schubertii]
MNNKWKAKLAAHPAWLAAGMAAAVILWFTRGEIVGVGEQTPPTAKEIAAPLPKVRVRTMVAEPIEHTLTLYGRTEPERVSRLAAEVSGRIEAVLVEKGCWVDAGQPLLRIAADHRPVQLKRAEAQLALRELEVQGARKLAHQGFQGRVQLIEKEAALAEARADVERLRLELANTTVRAPFAGILNSRSVEVGQYVGVGDPLLEVADNDPLLIRADVTELDIGLLNQGGEAHIRLSGKQDADGVIRYLSRVSDPATNTFAVEVTMANPGSRLPAGTSAELQIPLGKQLAIPLSPALLALDEAGRLGIKSVEGDKVKFTPARLVRTGPEGSWLGDVGPQLDVITVGQGFVSAGDRVEVVREAASGETRS